MIRSLELFSGAGGLALGLHQAGFKPVALVEWDKDSCESMRANILGGCCDIGDWNVIQADVRELRYSNFGSEIQFITGGPPCQPFSLGGKHGAFTDSRDMFPEAVRCVRELRPLGFILENVKGLLRKSFSSYFNYILLQLTHPEVTAVEGADWSEHLRRLERYHTSAAIRGLEYNVVFRLLNAADYGVPQTRHRVVIVGFRNDLNANWSFPEPTHSKDALEQAKNNGSYWDEHSIVKQIHGIGIHGPCLQTSMVEGYCESLKPRARWLTVRDALVGLPDPRADGASFRNHEFRNGARRYVGHSGSLLDEPSKTIKAGAHGVPGGENMLHLDNDTLRYYTVRESARIQTFPDEYVFAGSWTESMRQIGNAVPVRLAKIIGDSVIKQLEKVDSNVVWRQPNNQAV